MVQKVYFEEKSVKKVTFLLLHLGYGGAEKANVEIANMLADDAEVELLCSYRLQEQPAFALDERVHVRYLMDEVPNKAAFRKAWQGKQPIRIIQEGIRSIRILHRRKATMIKAIQHCDSDIIVSSRVLFTPWLARYKNDHCITIAQEHNDPLDDPKQIKRIIKSCRGIDYFMPVSKTITAYFEKAWQNSETKIVYIPHVLDYYPETASDESLNNIISIGRLSWEKGFIDLIEVFSLVHRKCPSLTLDIVGDGDERERIERRIQELGLEEHIHLHGFQNKPYIQELLAHSMMYAMPSYRESFGIVLLEAQAYGLPCVAFSSARGACELIHEDNGQLIDRRDHQAMANCLIYWYNDKQKRECLGNQGRIQARSYTKAVIKQQWLSFLFNR